MSGSVRGVAEQSPRLLDTLAAAGADKEEGRRPTIVSAPAVAQEFGLIAPCMWQNRLDFRRIVRIGVCVGRWTWLPDDTIRARLAICGALGGASVIPTPRPNGAHRHVDAFRQEVFKPQERRAEEDARQIQSCAWAHKAASIAITAETPAQALETSPKALAAHEPQLEGVTKQERILTLLSRPEGASIEEMMQATDWQQHSVRGFLAGTVKKKLGFPLTSSKAEAGARRYRIETRRGR